jgi:PPOX class probable F420-dependent enzyme
MPRSIATNENASREELLDFLADRHHAIVITARQSDGRPQASPVSAGVDPEGRVVVATYPDRAKANNARANPEVSVVFLSDDFGGAWVQVDGTAEVLDTPDEAAVEGLVTYFRSIAGEHDDWDEYREAMVLQEKSLLRVTIERWGPIATGGFPPDVAARLDDRDAAS